MPFAHGVLSSSIEQRTELWACQDSPSSCPYRDEGGEEAAGRRFRCLALETPAAATELLLGAVGYASDISLLRGVLSKDPRALRTMTDSHVINRVAELIASRRLCLVTEVGAPRRTSSGAPSARPRPRSTAVTPSRLAERASPAVTPSAAPAESEFADEVNQALQASALEDAAASGVPFCEVCDKAKEQGSTSGTT